MAKGQELSGTPGRLGAQEGEGPRCRHGLETLHFFPTTPPGRLYFEERVGMEISNDVYFLKLPPINSLALKA